MSFSPSSPNSSTPIPAAFRIDRGGWKRSSIATLPRAMPRFLSKERYWACSALSDRVTTQARKFSSNRSSRLLTLIRPKAARMKSISVPPGLR